LELASSGRLIASAGASLGAIGFLFSNGLILIFAALLCVYLLAEGISFRRAVNIFEDSVRLETSQRNVETTVGLQTMVETTVQNSSDLGLRVVRFRRNFPPEIRQEILETELLLQPHSEQPVNTVLEVAFPGRFETNSSTLHIEGLARLFRHFVTLPDEVTLVARPIVGDANPLPSLGGLSDLAADPVHRGIGTELAGIHSVSSLEDLGRIDWKATARIGKLMARDFYLERDPPIVLLVDTSVLTVTERATGSISKTLLGELASLLANAQLARNPIGLILYDDRAVIAKIEARPGLENRERILHTLLEGTKHASAAMPVTRQTSKPYYSLAAETETIAGQLASAKTEPIRELFASFAVAVLPFYRKAMSRYLPSLRREGVFKAFEVVCELPEPVLMIAISDGRTNLDGLFEGSRYAATFNHRVILAIVSWRGGPLPIETLSDLNEARILATRCTAEDLWMAIDTKIALMSGARSARIIPAR
jgi:uncharacterized protein (DUF58 family)